jgi:hypothetical protein
LFPIPLSRRHIQRRKVPKPSKLVFPKIFVRFALCSTAAVLGKRVYFMNKPDSGHGRSTTARTRASTWVISNLRSIVRRASASRLPFSITPLFCRIMCSNQVGDSLLIRKPFLRVSPRQSNSARAPHVCGAQFLPHQAGCGSMTNSLLAHFVQTHDLPSWVPTNCPNNDVAAGARTPAETRPPAPSAAHTKVLTLDRTEVH